MITRDTIFYIQWGGGYWAEEKEETDGAGWRNEGERDK